MPRLTREQIIRKFEAMGFQRRDVATVIDERFAPLINQEAAAIDLQAEEIVTAITQAQEEVESQAGEVTRRMNELAIRERELAVRERELAAREREQRLNQTNRPAGGMFEQETQAQRRMREEREERARQDNNRNTGGS